MLSRDDEAMPAALTDEIAAPMVAFPREVARLSLPTPFGQFELRAFESATGFVHLALVKGRIGKGRSVLTRLHSACLDGAALGSTRCDCGPRLRTALRAVAEQGGGVVIHSAGLERRGVGLVNELRTCILQDGETDTAETDDRWACSADSGDHREAARVLTLLGVRSIRLLADSPRKARAARAAGIIVEEIVPLVIPPTVDNVLYLETERRRLVKDGLSASPVPRPQPILEARSS